MCTNEGKYCTNDPDEDILTGASGADVVAESLRRLCIWQIYGQDGVGSPFWDYSDLFMDSCDDPTSAMKTFSDPDCIRKAMVQTGIDPSKVEQCMTNSGGLEGNVHNTIFDAQLASKETAGVFLVPSFYVNQVPIRGALSFSTLFRAICAGYAPGYEPKICQLCSTCHDEAGCVHERSCSTNTFITESGGVSFRAFLASVVALTAFFATLSYVGYARKRRHMQEEVKEIVAQYVRLEDTSDNDHAAI